MSRAARAEPRVTAILGPTNTGKTHRAIERMLQHDSGMIGLPLRLLAREVYDKVVARRGTDAVALVTGEEKRIPADPKYFVCTVEAMPVDRRVAFLAVDEVQLAGDRNRGHTFTDRILNARGVVETVFLGAMTVAPLLERIVPDVRVEVAPRFSKLTYAGARKLVSVPPRSAVIGFSAEQVYENAERLRAVHGGAAVVLGALSPRTRNAQVAMYQAGEVQHLVATDAIGMGLNMDITHVAFSALRKFDGRGHRALLPAELAQIAGRAGRWTADGTFGTTRDAGELDPELVAAIESHDFAPLTHLFWRSSDLDLSDAEALLRSLRRPPPFPFLLPAHGEEDEDALEALARIPEVARLLTGPEALARLWAVCQVPDYRKTHTAAHVELLGELAGHVLGPNGTLPDDFVERSIARLDRTEGDIETLMSRIAWTRTWTYVAWQRDWTRSPGLWQDLTRAVEDRLSDALHERLTARFVDRRVTLVVGGSATPGSVTVEEGRVLVGGIPVGSLRDGSFEPGPQPPPKAALAAVRRRLRSDLLPVLDELDAADDSELRITPDARVTFRDLSLGRVTVGPDLLEFRVGVGRFDLLEPPERERIRARLDGWRQRVVVDLFAVLDRPATAHLTNAGRGLLHALRRGLGSVDREEVEDLVLALSEADRKALAKLDVRVGTRTVYVQSLLRPAPMALRAALWSLHAGKRPIMQAPPDGRTSVPLAGWPRPGLAATGFRVLGDLAVRVDVIEQAANDLRVWARGGPPAAEKLMSRLGCRAEDVDGVIRALGFRSGADGTLRRNPAGPGATARR